MAVNYCPVCQIKYMVADNSGDYSHDCGDFPISATLGNEDVLDIHTSFTNPDGTSGTNFPADLQYGGIVGKNWGSRGQVEGGEQVQQLTTRGNPVQSYRTRKRFTYIKKP